MRLQENGQFPKHQFVGEDSYVPDVYFGVIEAKFFVGGDVFWWLAGRSLTSKQRQVH